jgi:hypothetical protein
MDMNRTPRLLALTFTLGLGFATSLSQAAAKCPSGTPCVETRSFVATVTNLRSSTSGKYRVLSATVHLENKTGKPLTLGYVHDSGLALDDLGNRYAITGASSVRAIGEVNGTEFDPKFTLAPGEARDARFELTFEPGKQPLGKSYELDLALREITPTTADQFKLGQEHAVHFDALVQTTGKPVVAATPAPDPGPKDPCGGSPRCYNAGTFIAEVMQVTSSAMTAGVRHQTVAFNIRFKNISEKPVILAYRTGSSTALDNFGNRFLYGRPNTHDTSVKGIGLLEGRNVDTQFQLAPGQSRAATFNIIRFEARPPIGNAWNYDLVIDEIEVLPGQVVQSQRQNSISYSGLTAGSFPTVGGGGASLPSGDGVEVANKVIDLFNSAKKKKN